MSLTLNEYIDSLKGKKAAVLGVGISNRPLVKLLAENNIDVTVFDRKNADALGDYAKILDSLNVRLVSDGGMMDDGDYDVIFRSPGIRPDRDDIKKTTERGAVLTSEMEVFFDVCPCRIIGITGSDGKTTTTTLVSELLRTSGYTVHLGGNIGHPLLADVGKMSPEDVAVVELSSFQLMTMKKSPDVAVITNLSPNHLDIHASMEEYVQAKQNIYSHQSENGIVVLNYDNDITGSFIPQISRTTRTFSSQTSHKTDVYLENGAIYSELSGKTEKICDTSDILIIGVHNYENYMAAIAATYGLVSIDDIRKVASEFPGVEHRTEFVRELRGVKYYNNSIASSPTRVIAGLRTLKDKSAVVMAGGYDKNLDYVPMVPLLLQKAKHLVLCGAASPKIRAAVEADPNYKSSGLKLYDVDDFAEAVKLTSKLAEPGDCVTLSPACASFDKFANFEERGNYFKKLVNELE